MTIPRLRKDRRRRVSQRFPPLRRAGPVPGSPGFTLIELLVVITIIAILATLTLQVVGGLLGQARDSATKATISKVQSLLNSRSQAFDRLLKRKGYLTGTTEYTSLTTVPPTYPKSTQSILAIKMLQKKYFPQRYSDADPILEPNIAGKANASSIEILYDFLTQSNVLGDSPLGTDSFSSAEVKDTDNDGLPEILDGWGKPMRFYRWPTRFFRSLGQNPPTGATPNGFLNPINALDIQNAQYLFSTLPAFSGNLANDLQRDPDDPLQECLSNVVYFESQFHTPATFHVFLVVSAGPDGQFGMYAPEDTANFGHLGKVRDQTALLDDIISLNVRAGGK
jgi:prepilin-type N-terminal cleavage/methylation domain-containing protein